MTPALIRLSFLAGVLTGFFLEVHFSVSQWHMGIQAESLPWNRRSFWSEMYIFYLLGSVRPALKKSPWDLKQCSHCLPFYSLTVILLVSKKSWNKWLEQFRARSHTRIHYDRKAEQMSLSNTEWRLTVVILSIGCTEFLCLLLWLYLSACIVKAQRDTLMSH